MDYGLQTMNDSSYLPRRQPFFYLTTAFITGILADKFFEPAGWLMTMLLVSSLIFSMASILSKKAVTATLALLVGFLASGAWLAQAERKEVKNTRLIRLFEARAITPDEAVELNGLLVAPPEPAPEAYYLDVEAQSLRVFDETVAATGRVRLIVPFYEKASSEAFKQFALDYGSRIRVMVRLERARSYKNPGSVDFNDFLERQGYDLKGTIKSPLLIESLGHRPVSQVLAALYHFRLQMMEAIDGRFQPPVAGTLKAMMFGNRYFLDAETSERLRQSSTFHTLVISGMHVSLIAFALVSFSLPFRPQFRREEKSKLKFSLSFTARPVGKSGRRPGRFRLLLAFLVLWAYTVMVGLAPPVTRAAVMISVGLLAPLLFRQAASINTVSLAAFLMLALKPALVADPGFQLSFIAVAAMVIIALPLANKLKSLGQWRPTSLTPHPPSCSPVLRRFAEILFWDERAFNKEMQRAPITYRLDKSSAARMLNLLRLQWLLRGAVVLFITSTAIQLLTLPLMVAYFNRVAPIGVLLNIFSGLLTGIMMFAALLALILGAMKATLALPLVWLVNSAHYLLVNSITPFLNIPGMTFRAAHYEGWQAMIYASYFVPIVALVWLIDRWMQRPGVGESGSGGAGEEGSGERGNTARDETECAIAVDAQTDETPIQQTDSRNRFSRQKNTPLSPSPRHRVAASLLCLAALLFSGMAVIKPPVRLPKGKLTVYFLDVGQGDCAFVVFPQGSTMLIDGGGELSFKGSSNRVEEKPNADSRTNQQEPSREDLEPAFKEQGFSVGESVVSRFLWSKGLTRVDYLLATHADADHIDGLAAVARNFQINEAIVGRVVTNNAEFDDFAQATAKQKTPVAMLKAGERFELEGVTLDVLWPLPASQMALKSSNNNSIVLRLSYGASSILFTGDIEKESEEALIKSPINLRSEVLKIPHHGSKTSSTEAFIDTVKPRLAIISVGERSRFGHPHTVVVERYQKRGVNLLQTGRDGMITVQSDGVTLEVSRYR
jgi:ComEC/Rec2-related protein